jgi:hypothetical protein
MKKNIKDLLKSDLTLDVDTITLEKMKLVTQQKLLDEGIILQDLKLFRETDIVNNLVYSMMGYVYSNAVHETTEETHAVPKTWWDAWKLKHMHRLPLFIQSRMKQPKFEYLTKTYKHVHVCPHLNIESRKPHMSFMMLNDTTDYHEMGLLQNKRDDLMKNLRLLHPEFPHNQMYMSDEAKRMYEEAVKIDQKLKENNIFEDM